MKKSIIFIKNVTIIDYSILTATSFYGMSSKVDIQIIGNIEKNEQVIIDFGFIKQKIKTIIDDLETGFDHKIWVSSKNIIKKSDNYLIKNEFFTANCPYNSFFIIDDISNSETILTNIINDKIHKEYPNIDIKIFLNSNIDFNIPKNKGIIFNYVHGLKNSSSIGCQNSNHGHKSWILFEGEQSIPLSSYHINKIKNDLKNVIFVYKDNIVSNTDNKLDIFYESKRGIYKNSYDKNKLNIKIINFETTIENLIEWFTNEYGDILRNYKFEKIYMSEGLTKGAIKIL